MKIIYRISDTGYNKIKPSYINNENCLKNATKAFNQAEWLIIADNISKKTEEMILKYQSNILKVNVGHGAGTFNLALNEALKYNDNEVIYFIENDYLHKPNRSEERL
jgi:cellulose synthase/poly-beta-1,6-N-acetylglucosamine synthase-like glycosyltransferase